MQTKHKNNDKEIKILYIGIAKIHPYFMDGFWTSFD